MEKDDVLHFNQQMRDRTRLFAINVYKMMQDVRMNGLSFISAKQLLRSSSSVAANFGSAARGRSNAEFYSKICIVVEECDETVFWLDFMIDTGVLTISQTNSLKKEAEELLHLFASIKRKMKAKRS
ncbi:MAG: four helix bundle protein [Bacteroidota bacterium]